MYSVYKSDRLSVCNIVHNDCTKMIFQPNWNELDYDFNEEFISNYLINDLGQSIGFSPCNKMFDNNLIQSRAIRFPENISIGEDMIFVLIYLSFISSISFVDEGLYHYNISSNSAMNGSKNYFPSYEKTLNYLETNVFDGIRICESTLDLWSRDVVSLGIMNPFFTVQNYSSFKRSYKALNKTKLLQRASRASFNSNHKKNILSLVLRTRICLLLYILIKANI